MEYNVNMQQQQKKAGAYKMRLQGFAMGHVKVCLHLIRVNTFTLSFSKLTGCCESYIHKN